LKKLSFGILGGDSRQLFLAELLKKDGYKINTFGILKSENFPIKSLSETLESEILIFPLPVSRDGIHIQSTYISIEDILNIIKDKKIFCGIKNSVNNEIWQSLKIVDYSKNEDFTVSNAWLTAEGVLKILFDKIKKPLSESKCLITGFGRIGKILAMIFRNFKTSIDILIHSDGDAAWSEIFGVNPVKLEENINYDFIINTAPAMIFNKNILEKVNKNTYMLDLASVAGIEFDVAADLGIKAEHVLGIPGRFFPKSAAEFIKREIIKNLTF
jgi:dipicolinate synthase subunit A